MPTGETLTCSECSRKVVRTCKKQVTCGRWKCHNARTARLAREKRQAGKRGRYLKGCSAEKPHVPRTKCRTATCTRMTSNTWCSVCTSRRARVNFDAMESMYVVDRCYADLHA